MSRLSEQYNIAYILKPADHAAGVSGDSIHMGRVFRTLVVLLAATLTGDAVLTMSSGASEGTETTSETFRYRVADGVQAAASGDTYADWATSSSLTLTAATYSNKTLLIEIDSDELTVDQPWLTMVISSAASAFNASAVAMSDPRYRANDPLTIIK